MDGNHYDGRRYDEEYADYTVDIPFYVQLAEEYARKKVLEFCCGTGRLTIPLAQNGNHVVGVDLSRSMLDQCTEKLRSEQKPVRDKVDLHWANICEVHLKRRFPLVIVPFTSFLHMSTPEVQQTALANISRHMCSDGHMLVDIFAPDVSKLATADGRSDIHEKEVPLKEEGELLVRRTTRRYFPSTQMLAVRMWHDIYELEGKRRHLEGYWGAYSLRVIFPDQWRWMLQTTGFEIVQEWGDFQRNPFKDASPRMLFLCRKS